MLLFSRPVSRLALNNFGQGIRRAQGGSRKNAPLPLCHYAWQDSNLRPTV